MPVIKQRTHVLRDLLQHTPTLWRGDELNGVSQRRVSTGYSPLDAILPAHGWPNSGLVELIVPQWGIGELSLLLPLMQRVTRNRCLIWITPPHIPYAPALLGTGININHVIVLPAVTRPRDAIWTMEKALQTPSCALVLAWVQRLSMPAARRLQLAAESHQTLGFLFTSHQSVHSTSVLRLLLEPAIKNRTMLTVRMLKARGTSHYRTATIELPW